MSKEKDFEDFWYKRNVLFWPQNPPQPIVILSPEQFKETTKHGYDRQIENIFNCVQDARNYSGAGFDLHILGILGERAVSFRYDLKDPGKGTMKAIDLKGPQGEPIQVKAVFKRDGHLRVGENDRDDHFFLLTFAIGWQIRLIGWLMGAEAKVLGVWEDPSKRDSWAFFVRQDKLHPIHEFLSYVKIRSSRQLLSDYRGEPRKEQKP